MIKTRLTSLFAALLLAGCASVGVVDPGQLPQAPAAYKTATADAPALQAAWWQPFADTTLDDLVARALAANTSVQAAANRLAQARAALGGADAARLPQVGVAAGAGRAADPGAQGITQYSAGLNLAYELDLGGRLLHERNASALDVRAREQLLADARLLVQANVARGYLALRALDAERDIVRGTVAAYAETLSLTEKRARAGDVADLDLARVQAELAANEAEALALDRRRVELETALAVLLGEPASNFRLAPTAWTTALPAVPAGLPSELLQRRPDLAQSLAQLHAATAQVGIAEAAFYPSIKLTGSFGYSSEDLGSLISAPARLYNIGPSISLPIFEGGRNKANLASSKAQVDESLASFRGRMLQALREVDDALAELQGRAAVVEAQNRTLASSSQALTVARSRYDQGAVSYLDVTEAERTPLATERALAQLRGAQWAATAQLVKALGGGWAAKLEARGG